MRGEMGTIAMAIGAIVVLIILIARVRLNPFVALTLTALGLGLLAGVTPEHSIESFTKGFGGALARTGPVVGLGAVLGGILIGTGGADRVANAFVGKRPLWLAPWTICAAALLVGMPHLFDVSFIMLAPLVYTIARRTGSHLLYIGLPVAAGLYVSHGLLPPHPSPTQAVAAYHANTGLTLLYGLVIAIPSAIVCGPLFTLAARRFFGPAPDLAKGPGGTRGEDDARTTTASLPLSVISLLIPPGLMLAGTVGMGHVEKNSAAYVVFQSLNDPILSLLAAVIFAWFALGVRGRHPLADLQKMVSKGIAPLSTILLILGAGGGFSQMLKSIHLDTIIVEHSTHWAISPLLLAWALAALLRICVGSATVATVAASGIVAPLLVAHPGVSPELMALATASGAVMLSHVNDSGFWLFKEYFQLSVAQTFRTWTLMLCLQSLIGLAGVMLLSTFIG
ncbi:GntT/GntP/DsdX family permease [Paraburkholderia acidisoli]|uniref:Permease DsdX n=1 Tax=Paraburkholderia acidisoli TaxID=2571748 RepID=A0A7Z2GN52_9BURK|nr:gluconate:H+ symporter [Paraburkholderia acidisoli]QGZ64646.1 permease DsdX [Paraburkholderia acidisoli]